MATTLASNYKEIFTEETVTIIEKLKEDYELNDILEVLDVFGEEWNLLQLETILNVDDKDALYEFLKEHGNSSLEYYGKFVELCVDYDEGAVKAFIECMGIDCIYDFEEAYFGYFSSVRGFVEEQLDSHCVEIPSWVSIDHETTWECSLRHDYVMENGYYFRNI